MPSRRPVPSGMLWIPWRRVVIGERESDGFDREHFTFDNRPISADVFLPAAPGRHPACLILHGTFGLLPEDPDDILSFGDALAKKGIVVVLPHDFESTRTEPGKGVLLLIDAKLPAWKAACAAALVFMRDYARLDAGRLGVLGFSLGGHIALAQGVSPPAGTSLKCVVDFFGPVLNPRLTGSLAACASRADPSRRGRSPRPDRRVAAPGLGSQGCRQDRGGRLHLRQIPQAGPRFHSMDLDASRSRTVDFMSAVLERSVRERRDDMTAGRALAQDVQRTHPNAALLHKLFTALNQDDHQTMASCYDEKATFRDIAFHLKGRARIHGMWQMICEDSNVKATFEVVDANDEAGRVKLVEHVDSLSRSGQRGRQRDRVPVHVPRPRHHDTRGFL